MVLKKCRASAPLGEPALWFFIGVYEAGRRRVL